MLLTLQPMAAMYLNTIHAVAQEQVPYELGRIYRQQQLHPPTTSSLAPVLDGFTTSAF